MSTSEDRSVLESHRCGHLERVTPPRLRMRPMLALALVTTLAMVCAAAVAARGDMRAISRAATVSGTTRVAPADAHRTPSHRPGEKPDHC